MRTNIDIDDELMRQAMAATGATTKKAAVEEALRLFVDIKGQGAIRELRGTVTWCGPDDDWFAPDPLDPGWAEEMARRGISKPNGTKIPESTAVGADEEPVSSRKLTGTHGYR